jgi:hypothetical protein
MLRGSNSLHSELSEDVLVVKIRAIFIELIHFQFAHVLYVPSRFQAVILNVAERGEF